MKITFIILSMLSIATPVFSQNVPAFAVTTDNASINTLPESQVLRIEGPVSASWKGVDGCCTGQTAKKELTKAYIVWVKNQLYAHKNMCYKGSGHAASVAKCNTTNSGFPENKNSCRGGVTVNAYIEFAKQ